MQVNYIDNVEELEKIIRTKECMVYCAGKVAKNVIKYLSKRGIRVDGILVTDLRNNPKELLGISIYEARAYADCNGLNDKTVIVCALEKIHDEIQQELSNYQVGEIFYLEDKLYHDIEYAVGDYETEILSQITDLKKLLIDTKKQLDDTRRNYVMNRKSEWQRIMKLVSSPSLEYFIVNIVDHCNLRCKGCDHFACIADSYYVPVETIRRDVEQMSRILHGDNVIKIGVMGGEPLLHPDLPEILKIIRNNFPYAIIRLTTNGLLVLKQKEEFWKVCRENRITIVNTKYPINLDYEGMKEKAKTEQVSFQYYEGTGDETVKTLFKKNINLNGDSNPVESFMNCHAANNCNFLMEGKLYSCPFMCQSYRIFNEKFNQELRMSEDDYLDIYKIEDMHEIFEFTAKPKPYCRYCSDISTGFEWTRTKQEMSEWVDL